MDVLLTALVVILVLMFGTRTLIWDKNNKNNKNSNNNKNNNNNSNNNNKKG